MGIMVSEVYEALLAAAPARDRSSRLLELGRLVSLRRRTSIRIQIFLHLGQSSLRGQQIL